MLGGRAEGPSAGRTRSILEEFGSSDSTDSAILMTDILATRRPRILARMGHGEKQDGTVLGRLMAAEAEGWWERVAEGGRGQQRPAEGSRGVTESAMFIAIIYPLPCCIGSA